MPSLAVAVVDQQGAVVVDGHHHGFGHGVAHGHHAQLAQDGHCHLQGGQTKPSSTA